MIAVIATIVLQIASATKPLAPRAKAAPAPVPVPAASAAADSVRPESEVRYASQRNAPSVRGCYEREGLRRDPALSATVDVTVTVDPHGIVTQAQVDTLDVHGDGMSDVAACVQAAAVRWRFSSGTYAPEALTFSYKLLPPAPALRDSTHS